MQILTAAVMAAMLATGGAATGATPWSAPAANSRLTIATSAGRPAAAPPYRAPLSGAYSVITLFAPPSTPYGPGHLGLDLSASAGDPVLAAGDAVVRFTGQVAGRGVVVLTHPDGISTEYEPVAAVVARGQRVSGGQRIGTVRGRHRGCAPVTCLHWGARRGTAYLDPLALLQPLGIVRLLPWA